MDLSKEGLIQRLQKEGKITQDEAYLLRRKDVEYIPTQNPNDIIHPLPKIGKKKTPYIDPRQQWMEEEMERRMSVAENCQCNPANGGSGICGCTLANPFISC